MAERVYLDHSATTPLDPRVLEAMMPYLGPVFGNPASLHAFGQEAEAAVDRARSTVARLLGCQPHEVVFTSGGTESNNAAVKGVLLALQRRGKGHVVISSVEHPSVREPVRQWARLLGMEVTELPVDTYGRVDPDDLRRALRRDTALVSIMWANNEVGTLQPIPELARVCREAGVVFHVDAVQAAPYLRLELDRVPVDLVSLSAHKMYGPKGVGVLVIRGGTPFEPLLAGGGQEYGMRSGTLNVPGIVGMARALELAMEEREFRWEQALRLRQTLVQGVLEALPDARLTGHPVERLPHHASFVFPAVDAQVLLSMLDLAGFACSSGSACKVGVPEPSHVLLAMGYPEDLARSALRVTLGKGNTREEVQAFVDVLPQLVERARQLVL